MTIKEKLCKLLGFQLLLLSVMGILVYNTSVYAENEEEWMPDPALREAVREKLGIPADRPLTQAYLQEHLVDLHVHNRGIVDLIGLEHATDLQTLGLRRNKISDLSPLSGLTKLGFLNLGGNQISDLSPLAGLTRLEKLGLEGNQIEDLSPLAGLVNLKDLNIINNPISDLSPLLVLENLEDLRFNDFRDRDIASTIPISKLKQFGYDETCDLERIPSISERIENREYPSVFAAWGNIINLPNLSSRERLAYHDLFFSSKIVDSMKWLPTPEGVKVFMHAESAKDEREERLSLNPNMLFLVPMHYGIAEYWQHPEDWPYWLRDESGNRIVGDIDGEAFFFDYTLPEVQDIVVQQAVAFAKCGLFDGILFDTWREEDRHNKEIAHYYAHDILEASITLLRRVREAVGDDFLILVNPNDTKVPRSAPYVNGMFMETIGSGLYGYNHQHLVKIESTLLWGEQHLRAPQINCLEGWRLEGEPLDSPKNQQWMRLFTTMSLAFSDGYVLFSNTYLKGHHTHYWYSFWDADLGRPIGAKGQTYESINGLFIREFTNGWAVYNRSGNAQDIQLPMQVTGVESGITGITHTLPDLDGEIYLKQETGTSVDVNGDGVVNILDLVLVAQHLGETAPSNSKVDVNGDGIVNILDLVLIAQHLGGEMAAAPAMVSGTPDAAVIQAWIKQAQLGNDGTLAFQRGIANLQRLLASLIPEKTALLANYPNPFNPETWIPYHLANPSDVQITIYDTRSSIIRRLELGHQHSGYYVTKNRAAYWDGRNDVGERVANGIYFYQLQADQLSFLRKMIILK